MSDKTVDTLIDTVGDAAVSALRALHGLRADDPSVTSARLVVALRENSELLRRTVETHELLLRLLRGMEERDRLRVDDLGPAVKPSLIVDGMLEDSQVPLEVVRLMAESLRRAARPASRLGTKSDN